ncbi:MAG TPA: protein-disulfide reductase DsbD domain-containing protein, partial [Planctomycetaceae bacterium]|nr:protein-disulfide reductase DsbD domain-containing protein [Planctomycetaceae bacterium]
GLDNPLDASSPAKVDLVPADARPGEKVRVRVTLDLPLGSNTYSLNPDFSGATRIQLDRTEGLESLQEEFVPDHAPKRAFEPLFDREVEKYFGRVVWTRVFRVLPDARQVVIKGNANYQICDDQTCRPFDTPIDLSYSPAEKPELASAAEAIVHPFSFKERPPAMGQPGKVEAEMRLAPADAKPGDTVTLTVTMRIDEGWHSYSLTQPEGPGALPTELTLTSYQGLDEIETSFIPQQKYEAKTIELPEMPPIHQQVYEGEVSWVRKFKVKEGATGYGVSGELVYQVCSDANCLPPKSVPFALGNLTAPRDASHLNQLPSLTLIPETFDIPDEFEGKLGLVLFYAFLGGLILNVMPCVLPVLAIKILSFVKQAGESRARILQLNIAYSAGVIGVFLCLAFLASFLKLGWGELFQSSEFNLVMACVVFAMGLSLLGVFEIPIPGLAGGGGQREGLTGAFLTGVFATFLATPCAGPFVGTTLAWSVKQPTLVIYLVWGVMGIGMAFPYLLTGFFPQALKYLPKPGMWMVRFKEFSGFALMGAVIWIISFMDTTSTIPLLIMLMGISLALWMVGNLYDSASPVKHKNFVRLTALLLGGTIIGFGYTRMLPESEHKLDWVQFSEQRLQESLAQNKTILIDFTADWCLVCKQNEALALNTEETKSLVEKHGIVTMMADYTDRSPEIKVWLEKFKTQGVPLTVLISASDPSKPILFAGPYLQSEMTAALNKLAGQAAPAPSEATDTKTAQMEPPKQAL